MDRRDRMGRYKNDLQHFIEVFEAELSPNKKSAMFYNEDEDKDMILFLKREVCETCDGTGSHVNPSIDSHGLTADDFAEDPDFFEEYKSGTYDVQCYECGGANVVLCVDEDATDKDALKFYNEYLESRAEDIRTQEAERRYGA